MRLSLIKYQYNLMFVPKNDLQSWSNSSSLKIKFYFIN